MIQARIEHARRNREVCEFLRDKTEYYDWVVTTAFYAALHYVHGVLFPLSLQHADRNVTFESLDAYASFRYNELADYSSKHTLQERLVADKLHDISYPYRKLRSVCHTARYINFRVQKSDAAHARNLMVRIAEECERMVAREQTGST